MMQNDLEKLLDNEREWRRYMIKNIETMRTEIVVMKGWNLVFRLSGSALFAVVIVILEWKLSR